MPPLPDRQHSSGVLLLCCSVLLTSILAGCGREDRAPPVVVYAARDAELMQTIIDAYSGDTGVTILLTTESGRSIIDRVTAERYGSTADLVLTDAIGHLWTAAERDILRPSNSQLLSRNIPQHWRDPEKFWFALLVYGKAVVTDGRATNRDEPMSYVALGDARFRRKLCLSSAAEAGNQSLVAMLIAEHGERPAELIVRSWIANLALPVVADDARLLREIEEGRCGVGIVGSNAAVRHMRVNPNTRVETSWPKAASGGAYIDIVGAAVTRHAGNPAGATKLLEWLTSEKGQRLLAAGGSEYRLGEAMPIGQTSTISLAAAGYYLEDAVRLMERARWVDAD